MLLEKLQEHKNFTAHEKDVAEYILSHLDQISELSVVFLLQSKVTKAQPQKNMQKKMDLNLLRFQTQPRYH